MGRKIIKISAVLLAIAVVVSLCYYVYEKKHQPPVSADVLLQRGLYEMNSTQNYPAAIAALQQAAAAAPSYADVYVGLGRAYLLYGKMDSATKYFAIAEHLDPENETALRYLANISLDMKDTTATLNYFTTYLSFHPAEQPIWKKKYMLLLEQGNDTGADRTYQEFTKHFPEDSIRNLAGNYWLVKATEQRKKGATGQAYTSYKRALGYQPTDPEILEQVVDLALMFNDYETAGQVNGLLVKKDSTNNAYLLQAAIIHAKLGNEKTAVYYSGKVNLDPRDTTDKQRVSELLLNLSKNTPIENRLKYSDQLLRLQPANRDALLYAINTYLDNRDYDRGIRTVDRALRLYPSDAVFINKKTGILYETKQYATAIDHLQAALTVSSDSSYGNSIQDITQILAGTMIREGKNEEALVAIRKGLSYNNRHTALLEQLVTVYTLQNKLDDALATNEILQTIAPAHEAHLFRKAGLLEKSGKFQEAAAISYGLYQKHPGNSQYLRAWENQINQAQRSAMQASEWDKVITLYRLYPKQDHTGSEYAVNAYLAKRNFEGAISLADSALASFPGDSLLLIRKSIALEALGRYPEGLTISKQMTERFPADTQLRQLYFDQLLLAGKYYGSVGRNDTALKVFFTAYQYEPNDTFALQNLSAIYFARKQFDSSIYYADLGLQADSLNAYLLMKKTTSHEQLKQYAAAYATAKRMMSVQHSPDLQTYVAYLQSKTFNNQVGLFHLQSFFSTPLQFSAVTGIQYMRRFRRASITGSIAFGNRQAGAGTRFGLDFYYTHSHQYYSNAVLEIASGAAFPRWRAGYSLFRNFEKGWEAEIGTRYLGFDTAHIYTAVASLCKYINNTFFSIRGFYSTDNNRWYPSGLLTVRQYLNNKNDYLSFVAGTGRTPDDPALAYNIPNFRGYLSNSVGIGFQKTFRYRTILNASVNYTGLLLSGKETIRQYDVSVTLRRNF